MLQKANVAYNVKSTRSWNRKRNRGSGIGLSWNPTWNRESGIERSWNPKRNRESEVELSWNPKWNPESGSQLTLGIGVPFLTWFRNRVSNPGPVLRNSALRSSATDAQKKIKHVKSPPDNYSHNGKVYF